ncbi:divalent-cation tolerance protein CutA [soil metagenome]
MSEEGGGLTLIYTLYGDRHDAEAAARVMVEGGMAACANLLSPSESYYLWNGMLEKQREYPVLFKTSVGKRDLLIAALREGHPYDLPAILDWPARATADYARWVGEMTGGA